MIRKLPILAVMAAMASMPLAARQLTASEALERVVAGNPSVQQRVPAALRPQLALTVTDDQNQAMAYVFSAGANSGYMIVSADDVALPLLGYTDSGTFDPDNMPDNMRWWLHNYAEEISAAAASCYRSLNVPSAPVQRKAIEPLLTTQWSQTPPFNNMCPESNGSKTMVGCVATAMAQVMAYHKWPEQGVGSKSYTTLSFGIPVSLDFSACKFDWDNMLNSYDSSATDEQNNAVAQLMFAAGVSVEMNYEALASGAYSRDVGAALRNYFNYDVATSYVERTLFTIAEWEQRIYDELANVGPVYYAGTNVEGGHAFVCDGYNSDGYFHFNWGWAGMSDGYYLLSALDPMEQGVGGSSYGYNCSQAAVFGVRPPQQGSRPVYTLSRAGLFNLPDYAVNLGSTITINGGIYNVGDRDVPEGVHFSAGAWFVNISTNDTVSVTSINLADRTSGLAYNRGFSSFRIEIPVSLAEGRYRFVPNYTVDGVTKPLRSYTQCYQSSAYASVADGMVEFTESLPAARFSDVSVSPLYAGSSYQVKTLIENKEEHDFSVTICPALVNASGQIFIGDFTHVDLQAGETIDYRWISNLSSALVSPGDYKFYILDYDRAAYNEFYSYYGPVDVTVKAAPTENPVVTSSGLYASGYSVDGKATVTVGANVKCTEGYFCDGVYAYLYDRNNANVGGGKSSTLFLEKGDSADTEFTFTINAAPGNYALYLFSLIGGWNQLEGIQVFLTSESGIDGIESDVDGDEFYRLPIL